MPAHTPLHQTWAPMQRPPLLASTLSRPTPGTTPCLEHCPGLTGSGATAFQLPRASSPPTSLLGEAACSASAQRSRAGEAGPEQRPQGHALTSHNPRNPQGQCRGRWCTVTAGPEGLVNSQESWAQVHTHTRVHAHTLIHKGHSGVM